MPFIQSHLHLQLTHFSLFLLPQCHESPGRNSSLLACAFPRSLNANYRYISFPIYISHTSSTTLEATLLLPIQMLSTCHHPLGYGSLIHLILDFFLKKFEHLLSAPLLLYKSTIYVHASSPQVLILVPYKC